MVKYTFYLEYTQTTKENTNYIYIILFHNYHAISLLQWNFLAIISY